MIKKAVFSYYPIKSQFDNGRHYLDALFHGCSWILSTHYARKHYEKVELRTPSSCELFFNHLELGIDIIIDDSFTFPKGMWVMGKIMAYNAQDEPFIHIDNDVFLISRPPFNQNAGIVAQSPELKRTYYQFYEFYMKMAKNRCIDFPESWQWALENNFRSPITTSIFGGNDLETIKEYTEEVLSFVERNDWSNWEDCHLGWLSVSLEQMTISAKAQMKEISPCFICDDLDSPSAQDEFHNAGFVHIWGEKKSLSIRNKVVKLAKKECPERFRLLENVLKEDHVNSIS